MTGLEAVAEPGRGVDLRYVAWRAARVWLAVGVAWLLFLISPFIAWAALLLALGLVAAAIFATDRDYALWLTYAVGYMAFAVARTMADDLGPAVFYGYPIGADTLGGLLPLPSAWLQEAFRNPVLDRVTLGVHLSWFVIPPAVPFILWLQRTGFKRFVVAGVLLFAASLVLHVLLPTAPPWMASQLGLAPATGRVLNEVLAPLAPSITDAAYVASANDVAAMPSLHTALTVLCAAALGGARHYWRPWAWMYAVGMGFSLVYMAEHYLVDVVVGAAMALAAWQLAGRLVPAEPRA